MTDLVKLRELAEKAIAARQESKDPLNKSGIVGQRIFDRVRYVADNEFFKFLDWHGEYGQPVDGPHKILALLDLIEALEKALKPFADAYVERGGWADESYIGGSNLRNKDLRLAASTLKQS